MTALGVALVVVAFVLPLTATAARIKREFGRRRLGEGQRRDRQAAVLPATRKEQAVNQMGLIETAEPPAHMVRSLAGVLAGFAWPGRGNFEKLTKGQQQAALAVARDALAALDAAKKANP